MNILSEVSYVHRDISTGNCYLYDGRGILGDFEFAKVMKTDKEHEVPRVSLLPPPERVPIAANPGNRSIYVDRGCPEQTSLRATRKNDP